MAAGEGGQKVDEFQPHPVKDQLPGVDVCASSSPSWPEAVFLGFQHYLVMLGTTVLIPTILVPLMGGGNKEKAEVINTLLFVAGLNTLTQTLFGTRLPVVMGGSYAFIIPTVSIAISNRFNIYVDPHESMRAIQGALIIASLFHMIIGFFGFWRIFGRFLSPLAAVPLVTLTGLGLYALGFPQLAKCVEIGLPALVILVLVSQYIPHMLKSRRGTIERFSVLFTVAVVWGYAEILTLAGAYDRRSLKTQLSCRTDRSGLLSAAPWIRIPYPFQWGLPSFNAGDSFAMMASSLVAIIESTGTFIAASRYGSATPMPPSVLSRGIGWQVANNFIISHFIMCYTLWPQVLISRYWFKIFYSQGIGILLDGAFGTGSGTTASVENAGLLGLTRNGSRRVVQISAGFMIFFSILGKFGAVLASILLPIVAALYCVFFAYVGSAGLSFLQFCNLNSFRTKFILGFSLCMGLSVPQYFNEYVVTSGHGPVHSGSTAFNNIFQVIFSSPATVAIIVAYFLDCTHSVKHSETRRDSGRHWWTKFRYFERDSRSEEFYLLAFKLNRFFPSI
ncbi:nucleobase-ascorbate transporter 4-like isoform X2 [Mangifera indica]|uniref:nucleobase-ascorbate transporter 4-like isoform X2 n=1 Tax=Mangifera indica TaxID=29780 RepID=UPI001CF93DF4|nr:nucleobase-ascorbate transporter 4-like isoform X2 [Mangifera indica]